MTKNTEKMNASPNNIIMAEDGYPSDNIKKHKLDAIVKNIKELKKLGIEYERIGRDYAQVFIQNENHDNVEVAFYLTTSRVMVGRKTYGMGVAAFAKAIGHNHLMGIQS